ncbi:hypothetical protein HSR121_2256 [Halapricum desulfuricans]|uniref:Uncharacterized protein n=1 Tax=Halapricum desulfuricans TaxID=2841257 RepID=A0A897N6B4_9EURY|nr:hypothetical protein HSR121_2256 [Halapricum desulfuricans]
MNGTNDGSAVEPREVFSALSNQEIAPAVGVKLHAEHLCKT